MGSRAVIQACIGVSEKKAFVNLLGTSEMPSRKLQEKTQTAQFVMTTGIYVFTVTLIIPNYYISFY